MLQISSYGPDAGSPAHRGAPGSLFQLPTRKLHVLGLFSNGSSGETHQCTCTLRVILA